jgi:hypothetical protein
MIVDTAISDMTMGYAILNAAGLSFIGLGISPPTPKMGHHGSRGRRSPPALFRMPERASIRASPQLARLPIGCSDLRAIDLGNASA